MAYHLGWCVRVCYVYIYISIYVYQGLDHKCPPHGLSITLAGRFVVASRGQLLLRVLSALALALAVLCPLGITLDSFVNIQPCIAKLADYHGTW